MTDLKTEMLEDARWVDAHALYNFKECQNHDALRKSQRAAEHLRLAASLLHSPQPSAVITEEMVERALARSRDKDLNTLTNSTAMREILAAALEARNG